jgi:hypothetical protein
MALLGHHLGLRVLHCVGRIQQQVLTEYQTLQAFAGSKFSMDQPVTSAVSTAYF